MMSALKLCLVTHIQEKNFSDYQSLLAAAIQGGVTSIQLREKNKNPQELFKLAQQLKILLNIYHIPLIINDDVIIAKEINADGVHLGPTDFSPQKTRAILGPNKIIGWSVETFEQLTLANELDCIDYIAASAVFESKTKLNCKTIWGLSGLKKITELSKHPVIGIGGIDQSNIASVMQTGAYGAAVISAIHDHRSPTQAAAELITEINKTR